MSASVDQYLIPNTSLVRATINLVQLISHQKSYTSFWTSLAHYDFMNFSLIIQMQGLLHLNSVLMEASGSWMEELRSTN